MSPQPPLVGLTEMSSISYSNVSSVLVYGPAGVGKTSLVFSFPAQKRFVFDFEAGLKVVKHVPASVFRVTNYTDLFRGIQWIEQDTEHDVVIVDSLTELGRVMMLGAMQLPGNRTLPELPALQDWTLTIERLRNTVRRIRLLIQKGKWVFFTAASSYEKDSTSGRIVGRPEVPGKQLPDEIPYLMDEVYRMDAESTPQGPARVLWTQPDSIWTAKTRVRNAPAKIVVQKEDPKTLAFLKG